MADIAHQLKVECMAHKPYLTSLEHVYHWQVSHLQVNRLYHMGQREVDRTTDDVFGLLLLWNTSPGLVYTNYTNHIKNSENIPSLGVCHRFPVIFQYIGNTFIKHLGMSQTLSTNSQWLVQLVVGTPPLSLEVDCHISTSPQSPYPSWNFFLVHDVLPTTICACSLLQVPLHCFWKLTVMWYIQ